MLNDNLIEQWKDIIEYEEMYQISNYGRVKSKSTNKIRKTFYNNSGYECIDLNQNGFRKKFTIHRLVALHFVENLENKKEVNHIDEDKTNNYFLNLEWCSSNENKQHSIKSGKYSKIFELKNTLGKKHLPKTHSKYYNVSYDSNREKWVASIRVEGKNMMAKRFNTEVEAALHVNHIIDTLSLTDRPKNIII